MYYVPDGTRLCGFYECSECHSRFLSLMTAPSMICPACGKIIEGEEEVEKYDTLLSLAITGGDYEWI